MSQGVHTEAGGSNHEDLTSLHNHINQIRAALDILSNQY